ncbi:hypothetical protein DFP72DRAFT_987054 [Ephemerocybe angulata]|uniref:Uncharacterized protein n=1 Tax=Ephemerocybe angulata TaxID=980116 RepID=A0A8H6IDU3_9AGAR|nr:hypothetical protein DFP72DRAFT_987054 [Tulosesus angulatus]
MHLRYSGTLPENPPAWMTQGYELCIRDAHHILHHQLGTPDFASEFEAAPYQQYQADGERVFSNLLLGDWAWCQADEISEDHRDCRGVMLVPVISGLDKTTVSMQTGHQEYHPVYISPGNLTNIARRGHENGVMPIAFLPIPKVNKCEREKKEYKQFIRQLYHGCLQLIFEPLRAEMSTPEIVRCPDSHYWRVMYTISPVIADYPEQVWLSAILQGWCPKCMAHLEFLDDPEAGCCTHELTDALIDARSPGDLWDEYRIQDDVVVRTTLSQPFTHSFPRADIHELMAPDLLHQVIKETFKDYLVEWVMEYLHQEHGEAKAQAIIADIDQRISSVPIFPSLHQFADSHDFVQWTRDDSKVLMKVYLTAIVGYVPPEMVRCLAAFLDVCYIFRRNAITISALEKAEERLSIFYEMRKVFIDTGVPCTVLFHPIYNQFGSLNGLCSSITERSNCFNALSQMLVTINRLDKMNLFCGVLERNKLLNGSVAYEMVLLFQPSDVNGNDDESSDPLFDDDDDTDDADDGTDTLNEIGPSLGRNWHQCSYLRKLEDLARYIHLPHFQQVFLKYLWTAHHGEKPLPPNFTTETCYPGHIFIYHSAVA